MRTELLRFAGSSFSKRQSQPAVEPSTGVSAAHICEYGGSVKNIYLGIAFFCSLFIVSSAATQTFEINGQSSDRPKPGQQKKGKKGPSSAVPSGTGGQSSSSGLSGYGGSIEGVRFSRAATEALRKGNYAAAMNYAQRLSQHQPNDANAWFLLGYSARLAGQYQVSLDAYKRGLQINSHSVEGLSGMAQTYMRMGRSDDAKRILLEVIAANPQRATDPIILRPCLGEK